MHSKKIRISTLVMLLLFVSVSGPALASWKSMGESEVSTVYYETDGMAKEGGKVRLWSLIDLKAPDRSGFPTFTSSKAQTEFDCQERKSRVLSFAWYSGNMGGGDVVAQRTDVANWESVSRDTVLGKLWRIACGER